MNRYTHNGYCIYLFFSLFLDALERYIQDNIGPDYTCRVCGKACGKPHSVRYHIESAHGRHFNVRYACEFCQKVVISKNAYITHKSRCRSRLTRLAMD
jgi:hypothetical protein